MRLLGFVPAGGVRKWIRRHCIIITANISVSLSLIYLRNKRQTGLIPVISLFCLAGTWLYVRRWARNKLSQRDVIVITGCDSGLGYSLALHCRELGAQVIAGVLNKDGPGASRLSENNVHVHPLDVTDIDSVKTFCGFVHRMLRDRYWAFRCLINNAGIMILGEFEWQTEDQIRRQLEVNFLGATRITKELLPFIRVHLSRVIIISSHCTSQPLPGAAAYGASKAAINDWATGIRVELRKYGITVVNFVPGSFICESNILARQSDHFETMRAAMSDEARRFYGDYFTRYSRYFNSLSRETEPRKVVNEQLYDTFEGALLDRYPSAVYKCESWRYFFYHTICGIVPTRMRDLLIERFVQLPPWQDRDKARVSRIRESAMGTSLEINEGKIQTRATPMDEHQEREEL